MNAIPLSIIIITYNNQDHIEATLDSLPWKRLSPHLILIDNRSHDYTLRKVDAFKTAHPSCSITTKVNPCNLGYARAVNQGLHLARSEFLLLLGPDASLLPGAADLLIDYMKAHPDVGVVAPQLLDAQGNVAPSCRRFPTVRDLLLELSALPRLFPRRFRPPWKMPDFDHRSPREVDQPEASCLLIRKSVIRDVGGFDIRFPIFFNDVDWCRRVREKGWKIVFLPDARAVHAGGGSVKQSPIPMIWKSHQGFYRYFSKVRRSPAQRAANQLLGLLLIIIASYRSGLVLLRKGHAR